MNTPSTRTQYEIVIRGALSDRLQGAFPGLEARTSRGMTTLIGRLPDLAALHGVLHAIESLGLELVELRRPEPFEPDDGFSAPRALGAGAHAVRVENET
jgi:hypothetical protein